MEKSKKQCGWCPCVLVSIVAIVVIVAIVGFLTTRPAVEAAPAPGPTITFALMPKSGACLPAADMRTAILASVDRAAGSMTITIDDARDDCGGGFNFGGRTFTGVTGVAVADPAVADEPTQHPGNSQLYVESNDVVHIPATIKGDYIGDRGRCEILPCTAEICSGDPNWQGKYYFAPFGSGGSTICFYE
ncbi:hypothetical protein KY339_03235 [Candidatus Woesearchaeota archaeon]|nr:hypothetical protein [Candidatus Woesearchaeota archaeon]